MIHSFEITLEVNCDESLAYNCRPADLAQVIIFLLTNAADAVKGQKDGWIKLNATGDNKSVEISVTDSGPGFSPASFDEFLMPFFTTKAPNEGAGLGLTLAQQIITEHNGKLTVDHSCDNTKFVVTMDSADQSDEGLDLSLNQPSAEAS